MLFDCPPDEDFLAGLEQTSGVRWQTRFADGRASVGRVKRLLRYFLFPLGFVLFTRKIERVVAWQQFYGIMASVYARIFRRRFPITVMTFIHKPKRGLAGRMFDALVRFGIGNPCVESIIVFSPEEVDAYSRLFKASASKFRFVPLGIPEKAGGFKEDGSEVSSSYVFSAGRSNRDYGVLKRAAEDARVPLRIACPEETADGFSYTEILADCFDDDMERQLSGAFAVAVPLRDKTISSGQLVVLQAMRAGKPVVVSDNVSLRPYIREGETALVARRQEDWAGFIRMLRDDSGLARKLGEAGRKRMREEFTIRALGERVGERL